MTAGEVLNNVETMRWAVESVGVADEIRVEHLLAIHERLLAGTRLDA